MYVLVAAASLLPILCRDLKPENILLTTKGPDAQLKVIDFGTSDFCKAGQKLTQKFGTPYYVAPEVRSGQQQHCQVILWSKVPVHAIASGLYLDPVTVLWRDGNGH